MSQLNFHNNSLLSSPPPRNSGDDLPILVKMSEAYKLWNGFLNHLQRPTKYTLGEKIDNIFLETIELILSASYTPREQKYHLLQKISVKIDALKFFIKLLWEIKSLDNKKYAAISAPLGEIGKMIGGWLKIFKKETPPE